MGVDEPRGGESGAGSSARSKCEAHGLHYDPTRHSGCALCRRDPGAAPLTPGKATRPGQRFTLAQDFRSKTLQKGYLHGLLLIGGGLLCGAFALSTGGDGRRMTRIWQNGVEALDAGAEGRSDPGRYGKYTFYLSISYLGVDEERHEYETHFSRQGVKDAEELGPLTVRYIPETGEAVSSWEYESVSTIEVVLFSLMAFGVAGFGIWQLTAAHRAVSRAELLAASGHITSGKITDQEETEFRSERFMKLHYLQPDGSEKRFTFRLSEGAPALLDKREIVLLSNAAGDITFPLREDGYPLDTLPPMS